jgi:hypothetical protein
MDVLDKKTSQELVASLLGEIAKANNELRCSRQDIEKAQGRLNFALVLVNELIKRQGDQQ